MVSVSVNVAHPRLKPSLITNYGARSSHSGRRVALLTLVPRYRNAYVATADAGVPEDRNAYDYRERRTSAIFGYPRVGTSVMINYELF